MQNKPCTRNTKNTTIQNKLKHLKNPGLVTSYDLRPGNGVDLFLKEVDKEKYEKGSKWGSQVQK